MACGSEQTGLTGYFEDQVGRCPNCMKQAFGACAIAWLLWVGVATMGHADSLRGGVLLVFSLALTGLWALHLWRFTQDRLFEARHLYKFRKDRFTANASRQIASSAVRSAIAISLPRYLAGGGAKNPWCNCYFDEDCGFLMFCNWSVNCNNQHKDTEHDSVKCPPNSKPGSCDGRCRFLRLKPELGLAQVADYLRAEFEPFVRAAREEEWYGKPGVHELRGAEEGIPEECRSDLRAIVFSALDAVVGWDMVFTNVDADDDEKSYL